MSVGVPGAWRGLDVRPRYTERHIEALLPQAMWGIVPERPAPNPEYRPRSSDGRSSDMPAMFADMQRAWRLADMGANWMVRSVIFRHLALGEPQHEIAASYGCRQQTVSLAYRLGLMALLDVLNGGVRG